MKKIDSLLNKVELFERLALYSDRRSFLEALSQQTWTDVGRQEGDVPEDAGIPAPQPEVPSVPTVSVESLPKVNTSPHGVPFNPDVKQVRAYLNQVFKNQLPPITVDGFLGNETTNRVKQWGLANKLHLDFSQLFDVVKARAMGAGVADQLQPGPNAK